ncbi:hypothetical protein Lfu02_24680 [Longispora fulva]|uniref:Uncharacterized protein n=1 Tax=Longispora fulva TaxID=619741 RepID=A0A8J7KMT7_9ACTN|nr:hypothetical protein [Longispora fulva]MBG6139521.1 hypothetical protein [Longispora fulva]GIG58096.1 hypothetical protein Lfu02_24680 [Longispora fulva]
MDKRLTDLALGVTVAATASVGTRVIMQASTTRWVDGLKEPLIGILVGVVAGAWLAKRGWARWAVMAGLGVTAAVLLGNAYTNVEFFGQLVVHGLPFLAAAVAFGAVLTHAVAPFPKTRRPRAAVLAACWAGAVFCTGLAGAWLEANVNDKLFLWIAVLGFLTSLVPSPFENVKKRPVDPGAGQLLVLLGGLAVFAAVGPLLQPLRPTTPTDLMILYLALAALAGYALYASIRSRGPLLAGVALLGVVVVGTSVQLTVQLQGIRIGPAFAVAGAVGLVVAVAAVLAPDRIRRPLLMIGPAVTLLGLLGTLDVGGKPRFALWSIIAVAIGAAATVGAGLREVNRTTAVLTGGLLVSAIAIGVKLAHGIRVLSVLTGGTPGGVLMHWFIPCVVVLAVTGYVGYQARRG